MSFRLTNKKIALFWLEYVQTQSPTVITTGPKHELNWVVDKIIGL